MSISTFGASVDEYARGKKWYWYLPFWLLGVYAFFELFQINMATNQMPLIWIVPYSFDFVTHELAHLVTAWLPPVLTASAGSGSEILLGIILVVLAFWQRSYFASLLSCLWFNLAFQSAGQYMADAIPQRIPLVSIGGALSGQEPIHDWHFVFGQLHLLDASYLIGNSLRVIGTIVGIFGLLFTAWVLFRMSQVGASTDPAPIKAAHEPAPVSSISTTPLPDDGFTSLPINDHASESSAPVTNERP